MNVDVLNLVESPLPTGFLFCFYVISAVGRMTRMLRSSHRGSTLDTINVLSRGWFKV